MATTTYYMSGISLILQYLSALGVLQAAAGGQLTTNVGGSVGTPVTTYSSSSGLVTNPNPLTLSSTGTPVSASGAPVAFWVPGGTVVQLIVTDSSGNQLFFLDNVPALNDLTNATNSLQALLASAASSNTAGTGPVAGVDLVANAVKSYDVLSDVRAANAPVLVTGQTLSIEVQGGSSVGDGLGGFFYWSPTSTATDDGRTILKPTSLSTITAGRWLRYYPLGVEQILVTSTAQQVASSTVLTQVTALTATLGAGGTYLIRVRLQMLGISGTGQGYKVGLAYNGTSAGNGNGTGVVSANGTAAATYDSVGSSGIAAAAISSTNGDAVTMDYILSTALSGQILVLFAQNSSSANATQLNAGSAMTITRLG
jgi:hypothetical protein